MKHFLLYIIIGLCVCCNIGPKNQKNKVHSPYRTTDESRLFFQNIRSFKYQLSKSNSHKIDVYTHHSLIKAEKNVLLPISIANNYLHDEAYIILNDSSFFSNTDTLFICSTSHKETYDSIMLVDNSRSTQLQVWLFVYERLRVKEEVYISTWGKKQFLSQNNLQAGAIFTTLRDYFELINIE